MVVGTIAYAVMIGRAAVSIDPEVSGHTSWALVTTNINTQPSGFYRLPVAPGTPDGGLPVGFDHIFSYPGFVPFPTISSGVSSLRFTAGLGRMDEGNLLTVSLNAAATASYTPGIGAEIPGYASGLASVSLRFTSAPGTRLRITADAEQAGALGRFVLEGTNGTYELKGTGATQQSMLFADGVARLEWVVHAEVRTDPLELINEPRASGWLSLNVAEVPPPGAVFSVQPVSAVVTAGSPVTLRSAASAPAPITYQWTRDGRPIPGATASDLVLPCVQARDSGTYAVIATSEGVVVGSEPAVLTVNVAPASPSRLVNLSTRGQTLTGDDVLITGFVIAGVQPKRLLIRAIGPTLGGPPFGLNGVLGNPRLTLFRRAGAQSTSIGFNDDWGDNANAVDIAAVSAQVHAFSLSSPMEAVLLVDLDPGQYTAITDDVAGGTGVAIVELFDADTSGGGSHLVNLSTRGRAGVGTSVMIPGFVVSAEGPKTLLIRVVGPALAAAPYSIAGAMPDPRLSVYQRQIDGRDVVLFSSDDWGDFSTPEEIAAATGRVGAFALNAGSKDAALVATLAPGIYTVVGSSADGIGTGIVLVEAYVVP